jgi:GntR family transcriptional regulator
MSSSEKVPLYMKVVKELRGEITNGKYEIGEVLSTESQLIKRFNMSRTTIRSAIDVLEKEGFVTKKQGKGTIIRDQKISQNYNYLSSFTETLTEKGFTVLTNNISIGIIQPPESAKLSLRISDEEEVYLIQRTKLIENKPICFMRNYLVAKYVPLLERYVEDLKKIGLYQLLESEYNLEIDRAVDTITTYMSGPLEFDILRLDENVSLFRNLRTTFLKSGEAFEYVISIIRGDLYEYKVYLYGRTHGK